MGFGAPPERPIVSNREAWNDAQAYTKDVTSIARQLGFAAAGAVWILKGDGPLHGRRLLWALGCSCLFFVLDLAQQVTGAVRQRRFVRQQEVKLHRATGRLDGDYTKPPNLDRPVHLLWWLKLVPLIAAFVALGAEIVLKLIA